MSRKKPELPKKPALRPRVYSARELRKMDKKTYWKNIKMEDSKSKKDNNEYDFYIYFLVFLFGLVAGSLLALIIMWGLI